MWLWQAYGKENEGKMIALDDVEGVMIVVQVVCGMVGDMGRIGQRADVLERLEHDGEDKEAMRHRWMMNDPKGVGAQVLATNYSR